MDNEALESLIISVVKEQQGAKKARYNNVELAIELLQNEYELRLSKSHFLVAIDFLTTETKASVFIILSSSIRDTQLCKNTDIELIQLTYSFVYNSDSPSTSQLQYHLFFDSSKYSQFL